MPALSLSGLAGSQDLFAPLCASIPAVFLSHNDLAGAAAVLSDVVSAAAAGVVPVSAKNSEADSFAGLWFIRAAHLFAKAGGNPSLVTDKLMPLTKRVLQELISSAGSGGVRMDDGGLLIAPPALAHQTLRLNALWYSALETSAADFKVAGDQVADHFERLGGRFRRSFVKAYWCEAHGCICTPENRVIVEGMDRGDHGDLPAADQVLLTFLPASPIPRTKQRQLLQGFRDRAMGSLGILVKHPQYGVVESPLHRAWLALGLIASADQPGTGAADALAVTAALASLRGLAHTEGLPAFWRDGRPVTGESSDLLTTAEVLGTLHSVKLSG